MVTQLTSHTSSRELEFESRPSIARILVVAVNLLNGKSIDADEEL
jgi:hypothetical protein